MIIPDDNKKYNGEENGNNSDSMSEKDVMQMKSNKKCRMNKHQTVKDAK